MQTTLPTLFLHAVTLTADGPKTTFGLKVVRDADGPKGILPGTSLPVFPESTGDGYYRRVRLNRVRGKICIEIVPPTETAEHDIHAIALADDEGWSPASGSLSPVFAGCEVILRAENPISIDFPSIRGIIRVDFDPETGKVTSGGAELRSTVQVRPEEWKAGN